MGNIDLSRWQADYEDAPTESTKGGGKTEVPDGNYQVKVARVELKESKAGNPMLEWELDILGPRSQGRKLWRNNMLGSAENIKYLKGDLHLCGVTLSHINDLNRESALRPLIGVTLEVTKKTKGEYGNIYFNRKIELGGAPQFGRSAPAEPYVADDDVPF